MRDRAEFEVVRLTTEQLIERLAADLRPVEFVGTPLRRTLRWLLISLPWVIVVILVMGLRPDLRVRLGDPRWVVEEAAAAATAVTAAIAAFSAEIPGRGRRVRLLPLPPLALWLATLGQGCLQAWISRNPAGLILHADWRCLPGVLIVSLLPGIVLAFMLLRGSPIAPVLTSALGGLAAAALGEVGLRLVHEADASLMVLIWQGGTMVGLTVLAGAMGPRLLRWRHLRP